MTKKVIFNGIELSLPKYNASALPIFDYLESIVKRLENTLGEEDGNFQLSINVDFSDSKPPKHKIQSDGLTNKHTKEKVAKILDGATAQGQVAGSVRFNLLVQDR